MLFPLSTPFICIILMSGYTCRKRFPLPNMFEIVVSHWQAHATHKLLLGSTMAAESSTYQSALAAMQIKLDLSGQIDKAMVYQGRWRRYVQWWKVVAYDVSEKMGRGFRRRATYTRGRNTFVARTKSEFSNRPVSISQRILYGVPAG